MLQSPPDLTVGETLRWVEVETQCTGEQYWVLQQSHTAPSSVSVITPLTITVSTTEPVLDITYNGRH